MVEVQSKVLEEVALIRIVTITEDNLPSEVRPIVLQFALNVWHLRIELILLCRLCGIQILVGHTLCIDAYCLSSEVGYRAQKAWTIITHASTALGSLPNRISHAHANAQTFATYSFGLDFLEFPRFLKQFRITANACYIYPQKSHRPSSEVYASDHGTKVRISEHNTKQKAYFL